MTLYKFIKFFAPLLFATSIILTPVQGTTPSFIMLFCIMGFTLVKPNLYRKEITVFFYCVFLYTLYIILSQIIVALSDFKPAYNLPTITRTYSSAPFQSSIFTQSLYLIPCLICVLVFSRLTFEQSIRVIKVGAVCLAGYGLYEVIFYLLFGTSGDFLSNRTYADGEQTGSAFQSLTIAGFSIQRLKSLTLEPSVYGYSVFLIAIVLAYSGHYKTVFFLALTLILSTSGTFFFGFSVVVLALFFDSIYIGIKKGKASKQFMFFLVTTIVFIFGIYLIFPSFFMGITDFLLNKFTGESTSGIERSSHFSISFDYWLNDLNVFLKMFGVGFGVVRPTNMLMFLLINTGIFGVLLYVSIFIWPLLSLPKTNIAKGLKLATLAHLAMAFASNPEFSLLPCWIILGMCYSHKNN
jgi:hypothetical protein